MNIISSKSKIIHYRPNTVIVETESDHDGFLVLSDINYPDWTVTVDGIENELLEVDLGLRAVYITPGIHTVTFSFTPVILYVGIITSTITLLFLIFLLIKFKKPQTISS